MFHAEGKTDRQTDRQTARQTDMTKLIVNFRNYANAPRKNGQTYNCADLKKKKSFGNEANCSKSLEND